MYYKNVTLDSLSLPPCPHAGVIKLTNKLNGMPFNQADQELFEVRHTSLGCSGPLVKTFVCVNNYNGWKYGYKW